MTDVRLQGLAFATLLQKEVRRFWRIALQTVAAPAITALLYLIIFRHVLGGERQMAGLAYPLFLMPGLIMMSILQNAFANSSSSIVQSKMTGSMIFILLSPASHTAFYWAFTLGAMVRGLVVGVAVWLVTLPFVWLMPLHPLWTVLFAAAGGAILGALGLLAGIGSNDWDQLSAYQNFLVLPLTMLSGVFYSIHSLPPFWGAVSRYNPVFLMIDGFRYGFTGVSDVNPVLSFLFLALFFAALSCLCLVLLRRGWKLRY